MNIIILSEQNQNIFVCYKLAQATGNNNKFNALTLGEENKSIEIAIIHNDEEIIVNLWTSLINLTDKNNGYVILITELSEQEYIKKTLGFVEEIKNYDPDYKFIIFINAIDVSKYKIHNKYIYITPFIEKKLPIKHKIDDLINPCAIACCDKIYSIAAHLSNNNHINFIIDLITNMITGR